MSRTLRRKSSTYKHQEILSERFRVDGAANRWIFATTLLSPLSKKGIVRLNRYHSDNHAISYKPNAWLCNKICERPTRKQTKLALAKFKADSEYEVIVDYHHHSAMYWYR